MKRESIYIHHIYDQTKIITELMNQISREDFLETIVYKYTLTRALEIIGEAAKQISAETRFQYPQIPFREMAGLRDKLIHDYISVDYIRVWEIAENDIPELQHELEKYFAVELKFD